MKWVRGRFSLAIPENIHYIEFQSAGTRSAAGPVLFPVPFHLDLGGVTGYKEM